MLEESLNNNTITIDLSDLEKKPVEFKPSPVEVKSETEYNATFEAIVPIDKVDVVVKVKKDIKTPAKKTIKPVKKSF